MSFSRKIIFGSIILGFFFTFLLFRQDKDASDSGDKELLFYCAAGIKPPVAAAAEAYQKEYGVRIQLQYGGSGTLLSNIKVARRGDLYLAADDSYIQTAQDAGLVAEAIPLAYMRPVIGVRKGNPKNIHSISDLMNDGVKVAVANPDAAAVGKIVRNILQKTGEWAKFEPHVKVFKPTVMEVANDIKIGSVDAGIIWDATANQYPEIEIVTIPAFESAQRQISVGVMTSSSNPALALRFARYLGASDKGLLEFSQRGYEPVDGDDWAVKPKLVLFSGGVNRLAIEDTIQAFEKREGVEITRIYNGCGILVAEMKAGKSPDAYFACDKSFMVQVSDMFADSVDVANTDMVILVKKDNPLAIHKLHDLVKPGLKIGLANPKQSALGSLTKKLLDEFAIYDAVSKNVKTQTPTADLLVNQMRVGSLDAAIVYRANTAYVKDFLDVVTINHPAAHAVQPIAIAKKSRNKYLAERLKCAIRSNISRENFESVGFNWIP